MGRDVQLGEILQNLRLRGTCENSPCNIAANGWAEGWRCFV